MADLEGVIIGGAIGVAGSLLGPLILEWRKQLYAKNDKRKEKFEQYVATLYEYDHWVRTLYRIKLEGSTDSETVAPYAKLEAIKQVYFPEFEPHIGTLLLAAHSYELAIIHRGTQIQRTKGKLSTEELNELGQYARNYGDCLRAYIAYLSGYAKQEFPIKPSIELTGMFTSYLKKLRVLVWPFRSG